MVSAINSLSDNTQLPLLVLRLPELEQVAWREGKRAARRIERRAALAFRAAASRVLRAGDRCLHESGRDVFAIVVAAPSRGATRPAAANCRAILGRIASEMAEQTGLEVETGWALIAPSAKVPFRQEIQSALARGARERERYEFFAAIGHELRTPLASIRGYLETLIDGELDSPTSARFLQTAQREAVRMGRMIDGMFEFSLLDLSAADFGTRGCDAAEQIALAAEIVAPLAGSRGMTVRLDAPGPAPASIDSDACLQLVINLLENATKYGNDDGTIGITLRSDKEYVRITVDDDGPGVSAPERGAVFALRVRGKASGARHGAGIGLAIVKLIAERAGGSAAVSDSPLGGARFEVLLPAKAEFFTGPS
ncbi:MAG TPA: HAMP domain-containing sensor histidine kinase [Candidatus Rubrimentiphilum sp.]|nr:HAMP domain-containing sensor histidine kinase [Candidatus Rubrimentiphilum sp.]